MKRAQKHKSERICVVCNKPVGILESYTSMRWRNFDFEEVRTDIFHCSCFDEKGSLDKFRKSRNSLSGETE